MKEKKEFIQICGKIELLNKNFAKEICMNYKHFTIEERCCLREYYVKGKSYREIARLLGRKCEFGIEGITAELYIFQGYTEILSEYGAKEKQFAKQLPSPRNVLETRSIGLHRREIIANLVSRTDSENTMRDEDAVIQDDISLDR